MICKDGTRAQGARARVKSAEEPQDSLTHSDGSHGHVLPGSLASLLVFGLLPFVIDGPAHQPEPDTFYSNGPDTTTSATLVVAYYPTTTVTTGSTNTTTTLPPLPPPLQSTTAYRALLTPLRSITPQHSNLASRRHTHHTHTTHTSRRPQSRRMNGPFFRIIAMMPPTRCYTANSFFYTIYSITSRTYVTLCTNAYQILFY